MQVDHISARADGVLLFWNEECIEKRNNLIVVAHGRDQKHRNRHNKGNHSGKRSLARFFAAESARVFAESAISEIERTRLASASLPAIYPLPNSVIWYSEKTGRIEVPERSYSII